MIVSFKHKGLKKFWETGQTSKIQADHVKKITIILQTMEVATRIDDLRRPSFKLHALKGKDKGRWSVWVNGNWRITFAFNNGHVEVIDYEDYH